MTWTLQDMFREVRKMEDMQKFLEAQMDKLFDGFRTDVESSDRFCGFKAMNFISGAPDYREPANQRFYLLKYFPAYLVEYYSIYRQLLTGMSKDRPLRVLSIGCGWFIDYFSLVFACRHAGFTQVAYQGVDRLVWADPPAPVRGIPRHFERAELTQFAGRSGGGYDVIVFPRSFEELPPASLEHFVGKLLCGVPRGGRMAFVVMTSKPGTDPAIAGKSDALDKIAVKSGFRLDSGRSTANLPSDYVHLADSLRDRYRFYNYPPHILNFMINFHQQCPGRAVHPERFDQDCRTILGRIPKCSNADIHYRILHVERTGAAA